MVSIILVRPTHPGNIGAVARAMKTMQLKNLILVSPHQYPSAEATANASNAADILASAQLSDSVEQALADHQLVFGCTARFRQMDYSFITPKVLAQKAYEGAAKRVAILFGSERSGLSNEDIKYCHHLVYIPSNPDYCSLNLAQAVQIICYELHQHANQNVEFPKKESRLAEAQQMELFYAHFEQLLRATNFYMDKSPQKLMFKVRRLFNRALVEKGEASMLRGMLSYFEKHLKK